MRRGPLVLGLAIIVALLGWRTFGAIRARQTQGAASTQRPAGAIVQTARPARATLVVTASYVGEVTAQSSVDVVPRVSGVIVALPAAEGDTVRRGQAIVRLDPRDLRLAVDQAQTAYQTQRLQVDAAKAFLQTQRARLAQVQAGQPAEQIRQAEEQVRQARANLAYSRAQLQRMEDLFRQGYVSQQQVDAARLDVSAQEVRLRTAEEHAALQRREPRPEAVQVAQAQVQEAEVALQQAQSRLAQARVALTQARRMLAESTVIAPVPGVVGRRLVEVGQAVTTSTPLVRLVDIDPAVITIPVIERDLARIRPGMPVTVRTDALPGQTFSGRIAAISPLLAASTRTADAKIKIANPQSLLRPGMFATVEVLIARRDQALTVPIDAVLDRAGAAIVFVIRDGRAQARQVRTGVSNGTLIEITGGLTGRETVAVAGHRGLRDGAPVLAPGGSRGRGPGPGSGPGRPARPQPGGGQGP